MGEVENTLLMQRISEQLSRAEAREHMAKNGGGEPPSRLESRVAKVESDVENIKVTLADIKTDIRELRDDIHTNFLVTWGGLIAAVLGLAWLIAKGFKWL